MKRSQTQDNRILRTQYGHIYGVYLAADYVGQHEGGVTRLHRRFGAAGGDADMDGHRATWDMSDRVHLTRFQNERREGRKCIRDEGLALSTMPERDGWLAALLRRYEEADAVIGAWDDGDFAFAGYGEEGFEVVRTIHQAILDQDVALWHGGGDRNPFSRGGLAIARHSLIPEEFVGKFDMEQDERRRLAAAAKETGIGDRILGSMSQTPFSLSPYFALSPTWTHENRRKDTAHPVMFWLNPTNVRRDNHGYFTVEELDQWIKGEGPVPKKAELAKETP